MDIYKVAINLSMTSNAPAVLSTLTSALTHAHVKADQLRGSLSRVQLAAVGAVSAMAGFATVKGLGHLVDKGNEFVRVMRNMEQAGATALQVKNADDEARRLTSIYKNVGRTDIMKSINDARGIFGDQDVATHEIGSIIRSQSFLRAFMGDEKGSGAHSSLMTEMNAALKSGELAGKISPEDMHKHIDMLTSMRVAFGEQVKISQYLTAQRAAGVSMRNVDDRFRYGIFPALVQENGQNAGTMLMTAFNKVVAGVGNRTASIQFMMEKGLLNADQVKYDKVGRAIGLKDPDAIAGSRDAAMNFASWVMTHLAPKLPADPIRQSQEISKIFPDRNAAKAVTEIVQQWAKLNKDADLVYKAYGNLTGKGAEAYTAGSWDYQKQAFMTQFDNLVTTIGAAMLPAATENLRKLNEVLSGWHEWALKPEHAETLQRIGVGIGVLGTALIGGGAVAILAALGPAGWLAAGIIAFAGALVMLKDSEWLKNANAWIAGVEAKVGELASAIAREIASWPSRLVETITAMGTGIVDALKGVFTSLIDRIKGWLPGAGNGPSNPSSSGLPIFGGSYGGGEGGASIHRTSLGSAMNDNAFIPGTTGGLRLKSGETVAGGASAKGLTDLAADLQKAGGVGRFTAFNDACHAGTGSRHASGLAMDVTGNPAQIIPNVHAAMEAAGLIAGKDYKVLNEYAQRSGRWTGGHVHVEFRSREAAEAYSRAMRPAAPPAAATSAPPRQSAGDQAQVINLHIGGERVASVVSRQMAKGAAYPGRIGGSDGSGSWRPPGVTVQDVA